MCSCSVATDSAETDGTRRRGGGTYTATQTTVNGPTPETDSDSSAAFLPTLTHHKVNWKRILLLIIAITVHNVPGGDCRIISLQYRLPNNGVSSARK